jgi:hypothetical protein
MSTTKPLSDAEALKIAMEICRLLNGLTIAQAEWVLREASDCLRQNTRVDVSNPDLAAIKQALGIVSREST